VALLDQSLGGAMFGIARANPTAPQKRVFHIQKGSCCHLF
jgi:hypothetical protein